MHGHVRHEGDPPKPIYHRRFISNAEEIAPTPDIQELWYNQQAGKQLKITVTYEDGIPFGVILRQQFGQIHVSADKLPEDLTTEMIASYLAHPVAFIPGLVGVLVNEPYATIARRNSLANQGRYSEIFRSSLQQLKNKDTSLVKQINRWLADLFDVKITNVTFDPKTDEFVTVKYSHGEIDFDVVSSGAGLQQVIQILTYIYLTQPKILLIDEPDAHLHSRLQARLGEVFRRVATDLDAQVFLSTHSLDLVDTFSTNEVLIVDSKKRIVRPLGSDDDLISVLVDADVVDISALSRLLSSRKLVVVEDKDLTIFKAIDRAIQTGLFSSRTYSYVLSAKGVGNFRALGRLGSVLKSLTGSEFDLLFIQDRDGLPDFLVDPFLDSQATEGVNARLLERHEIENYLIEPKLIAKACQQKGINVNEPEIESVILESANSVKHIAQRATLEAARLINRHLSREAKLGDSELEEQSFHWFNHLDLSSLAVIQRVFPGKELLKEVIKSINDAYSTQVTKGNVVAELTDDVVSSDIKELLQDAAGKAP
jgi:energy-coupling factor transporter ATP-binding protein EcfA2